MEEKQQKSLLNLYEYNMCLWDISDCSETDINDLIKWTQDEEHSFERIKDIDGLVVISDKRMQVGSFGIIASVPKSWQSYTKDGYNSKAFQKTIPFGKLAESDSKNKFLTKYLGFNANYPHENLSDFGNIYEGYLMNHKERLIVFTFYTENYEPTLIPALLKLGKDINKQIEHIKNVELEYEEFNDNIIEIYLYVNADYQVSTTYIVEKTKPIFISALEKLGPYFDKRSLSTAEMIKYRGNRYFPENFIKTSL